MVHGAGDNMAAAIRNDGFKGTATQEHDGCDHTITNAPDPIPACRLSSQWVRPSPSLSAPGDRRSGHPIARYGPSKSCVWKIPSLGDDRRKRQAFWTVEAKVMGGNAWGRGWVP